MHLGLPVLRVQLVLRDLAVPLALLALLALLVQRDQTALLVLPALRALRVPLELVDRA